ncbi:5-methyltetrahydropteroyltriglutamate--homocysteine S-methyltransferase [Phyllobacterium myrsinacearum]|uniref:5-methyltetrahydropteroyltriglutamate--homocysteine methyltransferase n=1 Tax=Phyllobacterium myrsinacearum TaxID=28101 RepID=A0A2S9JWT0_9HYPH|nr:5-methyltetrahydropteroyltriglutamate--homocysteine S-methyltransferase [Phyllobacterium myrsinacearum]PRD57820.1 5-methyltetrahydropteroyltriglutamate--homocysteine S-methyltransferase [Phyllobacterium myrsinacearum]PWV88606.1 methionine synthase (B12-independent) [Phyllobacterium myrsinacearum]RZV10029.1 methionine synthase (B12-independent) [Phyllobacterium myrsinacearum]
MTITTSNLGFPRIGKRRELKFALEKFWSGQSHIVTLQDIAAELRRENWTLQQAHGLSHMPSNDFSLYDHVLDTSVMLGAVPQSYAWKGGPVSPETYFAMARGSQGGHDHGACAHHGVAAQEMTKWFDTNYHFMVPELTKGQEFTLGSNKPVDEYREAKEQGFDTRPVILGPVTFLKLAKSKDAQTDPLSLLPGLLPVYTEILRRLSANGAEWVQIDEPALVLDLDETTKTAFKMAYAFFARALPRLKLLLTPYFGALGDNLDLALGLPVAGLHLDLCRAPEQLDTVVAEAPAGLVLSLGVIDGRNVWRADLEAILRRIEPVISQRGTDHLILAPSCSLLHTPVDLELETDIDPDFKSWLAFATQKLEELSILGRAINTGRDSVRNELAAASAAVETRRTSAKIHDAAVRQRLQAVTAEQSQRQSPYPVRRKKQKSLGLPDFPTTTIGSFPQTEGVRKARAEHGKGALTANAYAALLRKETENSIRWQEEIGIDVLVHGEFERNDMVQYFGEQLSGFAFTRHGWVQSYGSRCVRPPVIFGDVSRPQAMTVDWAAYAQSLTDRPMKGMLSGPVTMMQWSFVRDDLPRDQVCRQIGLALRDEVSDLEKVGIRIIQIDEPAIREGLPVRRADWAAYLGWATECFRLSASGVQDETQIHTHMCYSEFNDIIDSIAAMDADVISIETSRSKMELLDAFVTYHYPNEIGPGVYDIHSPRIPPVDEMAGLLRKAKTHLAPDQIWVNPDCGLKTRKWEEVKPALVNMVEAAKRLRLEQQT